MIEEIINDLKSIIRNTSIAPVNTIIDYLNIRNVPKHLHSAIINIIQKDIDKKQETKVMTNTKIEHLEYKRERKSVFGEIKKIT